MNTPDPETEPPIIGIDLDDFEAFIVRSDLAEEPTPWQAPPLPPAVLLPRFDGESLDVDLCCPPHPRGLGDVYRPESRVEDTATPGRLPIAYAWAMLAAGDDRVWTWRIDEYDSFATPHEAIIRVVTEIVSRYAGAPGAATAALVTPTHLPVLSQRHLEEAARRASLDIRFVPRDIAAASAAMEFTQGNDNAPPLSTASDASWVLTMHLGLTTWEVGAIRLSNSEDLSYVSTEQFQRHPEIQPLSSYGLWIFEHMARRAIEMSYRNCPTHRVWELMWASPWMRTVIDCAAGGPEGPWPQPLDVLSSHVCRHEFIRQQVRQVIPWIISSEGEAPALYREHLPKTPNSAELRDWTIATKRALPERPPVASIVTGPLASLPHDNSPIGSRQCQEIRPSGPEPVITGIDLPRNSLARAAARLASTVPVA
ncbi:MAG: hypothetical protein ACYTGQ_16985 [Planctomycetota bacterium]|jgi:hypothetical protein